VPLSTMGSRRASAVRSWQGMRQKALAVPESTAAAAERDATDFIIEEGRLVVCERAGRVFAQEVVLWYVRSESGCC
jgi:hypothetical protein